MTSRTVLVGLADVDFPAGTVAGLLRIIVGDQTQDIAGDSAVFDLVPGQTYAVAAVRLDSAGNELGSRVTTSYTEPASSVTVAVPVTITVS